VQVLGLLLQLAHTSCFSVAAAGELLLYSFPMLLPTSLGPARSTSKMGWSFCPTITKVHTPADMVRHQQQW
jgi:hypothetical protein